MDLNQNSEEEDQDALLNQKIFTIKKIFLNDQKNHSIKKLNEELL